MSQSSVTVHVTSNEINIEAANDAEFTRDSVEHCQNRQELFIAVCYTTVENRRSTLVSAKVD